MKPPETRPVDEQPWWRFGIVWFVISGPAIVVVAGLTTAAIAWHNADPVVAHDAPAVHALKSTR